MKQEKEFEVPLTEDLMREHGVLNRVLLIYENIIDRIDNHKNIPSLPLVSAIEIIKFFIEGHHERMEEDYIFPLFEKHKKELKLIGTLKEQHIKGREITAKLETLATKPIKKKSYHEIRNLLENFIDMYRPHEAREDTEVFPLVRSFLTEKEFEELGEKFEEFEHQLFGAHGLQDMIKKIQNAEIELEINDLNQFTPE